MAGLVFLAAVIALPGVMSALICLVLAAALAVFITAARQMHTFFLSDWALFLLGA